jgi:hypothetical protein
MLVWAWEFLRRNPDYRCFWTEKAVRFINDEGFISNEAGSVMREAEERFGIVPFPHDPASSDRPIFRATAIHPIWRNSDGLPMEVTLGPNEIGYVFDLSAPLDGQFARALKDAKSLQDTRVKEGKLEYHSPKARDDKYIIYLRIIDAEDDGVNQDEIAEVIFSRFTNEHPDYHRNRTFRNHRAAAMRLRDANYRLLATLALSPTNAKKVRAVN